MHDSNVEDRLRSVLRAEGDGLSLTITTDELERRLALRRRARNGQRLSLMAAGLAALAVGTMFALGNGWLRSTNVATDPSPSPNTSAAPSQVASPSPAAVATPTLAASADPLAALPALVQDPLSVDTYTTESAGDPTNLDPALGTYGFDGVRMDAREAGIKVACLGPDVRLEWGIYPDRTAIASETVVCDGTVQSFRYDVSAHQPMLDQTLVVMAAPRTAFRLLVDTFGEMNDPVRTVLPSFAAPQGTVAVDFTGEPDPNVSGESVQISAGIVPPRGQYRVALACVGGGTIRWDIGLNRLAGGGEQACDGSALATSVAEGVPPEDMGVIVTISPQNHWRIIVTYDGDTPAFIAPQLFAFAGEDLEGNGAGGLAMCVRWNDISDSCGVPFLARDGAAEVTIPVGSSIGISLADGWRIDGVTVDVAVRDDARRNPYGESRELPNVEDSGVRVAVPLVGLAAGEWVVLIGVSGSKGDDTFGGTYSIPVIIEG